MCIVYFKQRRLSNFNPKCHCSIYNSVFILFKKYLFTFMLLINYSNNTLNCRNSRNYSYLKMYAAVDFPGILLYYKKISNFSCCNTFLTIKLNVFFRQ